LIWDAFGDRILGLEKAPNNAVFTGCRGHDRRQLHRVTAQSLVSTWREMPDRPWKQGPGFAAPQGADNLFTYFPMHKI
jgi:hypothetical protein